MFNSVWLVHDETPAEKLMSDIRGGKARQSLRRTRPKLKTSTLVQSLEKVASAKEEEKHKVGRIKIYLVKTAKNKNSKNNDIVKKGREVSEKNKILNL